MSASAAVTDLSTADRAEIQLHQAQRLTLLQEHVRSSRFYQKKFAASGARWPELRGDDPAGVANRMAAFAKLPFTTRAELEQDQALHPPYGSILTEPIDHYTRLHQTSASTGAAPLRYLDTEAGWDWWKACWQTIFAAAGVVPRDRIVFPFSFGPFIGFWSAFEAAASMGCLCLPAGGMSSAARIRYLLDHRATVVCCTPTYALHLAEVAAGEGDDLAASAVRALIVAGEPGGNIPATRARIEAAWGARVFDHAGATEAGPWGFETVDGTGGLFVLESEFIAECIDPQTQAPVAEGQPGELVLTNLGRAGNPLIRYRTGDLVRLERPRRGYARALGGVLGRIDDMLVIRGNNVFPAAIESILREDRCVAEFRLIVEASEALCDLQIELEPLPGADANGVAERAAANIRDRLHFRPVVRTVPPRSLPRFEHKARRLVRRDAASGPAGTRESGPQ